jgi:hypothetical protein
VQWNSGVQAAAGSSICCSKQARSRGGEGIRERLLQCPVGWAPQATDTAVASTALMVGAAVAVLAAAASVAALRGSRSSSSG